MSSSSAFSRSNYKSSSSSSCRYNSFEKQQQRSSTQSDPSSSTDQLKIQSKNASTTLAKSKTNNNNNLSGMVKKYFTEKRSNKLMVVDPNFIANLDFDNKKNKKVTSGLGGLMHKKLFGSGDGKKKKALTELKQPNNAVNARTSAMVLKSERELLSQNKDQESEIVQLKSILNDKNTEVDKLKDLCLKQREEIKALKSAILFPDTTQLQGLLHKQDSELKQAKHIIPTLQRQVTSLTDQLQCLAEDLAEVKADKYSVMGCYDGLVSSPRTPAYEQDEATNSLELSSGDRTTPGSPDDLFLNDLNPCLTPYAKSKSKDFEVMEYGSCMENSSYNNNTTTRCHEIGFGSHGRKLSKSSNDAKSARSGMIFGRSKVMIWLHHPALVLHPLFPPYKRKRLNADIPEAAIMLLHTDTELAIPSPTWLQNLPYILQTFIH
ncbi:hypothetical protein Tco_0905647 [Tanacetum coccineum]